MKSEGGEGGKAKPVRSRAATFVPNEHDRGLSDEAKRQQHGRRDIIRKKAKARRGNHWTMRFRWKLSPGIRSFVPLLPSANGQNAK